MIALKDIIDLFKHIFGKDGVNKENVLFFFISIVGFIIYQKLDKFLERRKLVRKKKRSIQQMPEQSDLIDPVLVSILKKLKNYHPLRACVVLFSNGGEFLNKMSILKMTMFSEKTISIDVKSIKKNYKDVLMNGRYDKLFRGLSLSTSCYFQIRELDQDLKDEFSECGEKSIFLNALYNKDSIAMGIVVIFFDKENDINKEILLNKIQNNIREIENILNI